MASSKAPGPNGVHGFWCKKLSNFFGKTTSELQKTLGSSTVPTIGRTILIMNDAKKGKVASNYKPVACLLLM